MPNAGRWAAGIGGGAASGAAIGSTFGPWGTAIGGVVGAGAGALTTGLSGSDEDRQQAALDADRERKRRMMLVEFLRNKAAAQGADTTGLDAQIAVKGLDMGYEPAQQQIDAQRAAAQQLDPNAFVGMASNIAQAANNTYNYSGQQELEELRKLQIESARREFGAPGTGVRVPGGRYAR